MAGQNVGFMGCPTAGSDTTAFLITDLPLGKTLGAIPSFSVAVCTANQPLRKLRGESARQLTRKMVRMNTTEPRQVRIEFHFCVEMIQAFYAET